VTATKNQKSKCDRTGQRKQRLYHDWKNEAKAQRDGDIYAHGSAFTLTLGINAVPTESTIPVLQQIPGKKELYQKQDYKDMLVLQLILLQGFLLILVLAELLMVLNHIAKIA